MENVAGEAFGDSYLDRNAGTTRVNSSPVNFATNRKSNLRLSIVWPMTKTLRILGVCGPTRFGHIMGTGRQILADCVDAFDDDNKHVELFGSG